MDLNQPTNEEFVRSVADALVQIARQGHAERDTVFPSTIVVIGPSGLSWSVVMDPSRRLVQIRDSVASVPEAFGYVFLHDGHVTTGPPGPRTPSEALLLIWGTRGGPVNGRAYPYERTPFGARFLEDLPAPEDLLAPYGRMFDPPVSAGRGDNS